MVNYKRLIMRAGPLFNAPVAAIANSPRLGARLRVDLAWSNTRQDTRGWHGSPG